MSLIEEFMEEARQAVAQESKSKTHKVTTMVWYAARKGIRGAPKKALSSVGAAIPVPGVGAVVNLVMAAAIDKVDKARKAKKKVKYAQAALAGHLEGLRKAAKAHTKDLAALAGAIDGNQVKLRDSMTKTSTAANAFNLEHMQGAATKDKAWDLACAIYTNAHYEDKLLVLVESARAVLDAVEKYVLSSRDRTQELEAELVAAMEDYPGITDESVGSAGSDGYARLK